MDYSGRNRAKRLAVQSIAQRVRTHACLRDFANVLATDPGRLQERLGGSSPEAINDVSTIERQ